MQISPLSHHKVVEKRNTQSLRKVFQFACSGDVRFTRRGVAGRMVVRDDDFLRAGLQRLAENHAWINCRRAVLMSDRYENRLCEHFAVRIERQHQHTLFLLLLRQRGAKQRGGLRRGFDTNGFCFHLCCPILYALCRVLNRSCQSTTHSFHAILCWYLIAESFLTNSTYLSIKSAGSGNNLK